MTILCTLVCVYGFNEIYLKLVLCALIELTSDFIGNMLIIIIFID